MLVTHAFEPVYDAASRILILGTMPSPQSVKQGFYYSHPQNRFWPLMSALLNEPLPQTPEEKAALVLKHNIALWDVLAVCEIDGASDASIRKPVANDFTQILRDTRIERIYTTGKTAYNLFQKHVAPVIGREAIYLPSTSPANQALFPWEKLFEAWAILLKAPGIEPRQPNAETLAAIREAEQIAHDPNAKGYASINELLKDLNK